MEIVRRQAHINLVDQIKPVKLVQSGIRYNSVDLFQRDMFNFNLDIMYVSADQSGAEVLTAVDHLIKQVSEDFLTLDKALSSDSIHNFK